MISPEELAAEFHAEVQALVMSERMIGGYASGYDAVRIFLGSRDRGQTSQQSKKPQKPFHTFTSAALAWLEPASEVVVLKPFDNVFASEVLSG